MKKRPTSITVISWVLIVMSGISLLASTLKRNDPMVRDLASKSPIPLPVQIALLYLGLLITLVCGVFFLRGKKWARTLYVAWSLVGFLFGLATSPMKAAMIPGFVVFVIIAIFLFRPKANEFFSPGVSSDGSQNV